MQSMHSSTVEQYIKIIYNESQHSERAIVQMKQLAEAMQVTPGTVTSMVKHLSQLDLAEYRPRVGVSLTESGSRLALKMLRRHRLIEQFLEKVLGYDWSEVHVDAERLEHAVSDRFIERLDAYLGHPNFDPHGDPIPSEAGSLKTRKLLALDRCREGQSATVSQLIDGRPDFLDLMKRNGILPGRRLRVEQIDAMAGTITVSFGEKREFTMGYGLGAKILVE